MSWPSTTIVCQPNAVQRAAIALHLMVELRRLALAEAVDVDHAAQVVELVVERDVGRFPDRSFRHLAVAEDDVGAVVGSDAPRVERRADRARRCPARAIRWRHRRTAAAASGVPRDPTRSSAASAAPRAETARLRPTPRTESARRDPSTARTDRCRCSSGSSDRTASRRRRAWRRSRPPTGSSSDVRFPLRSWTAPNRCGAGWRCSSERQAVWTSERYSVSSVERAELWEFDPRSSTELESLSPRTGGARGEHVVRGQRALAGGQRRHRGDDAVGDLREFLIARAQREPPQRA